MRLGHPHAPRLAGLLGGNQEPAQSLGRCGPTQSSSKVPFLTLHPPGPPPNCSCCFHLPGELSSSLAALTSPGPGPVSVLQRLPHSTREWITCAGFVCPAPSLGHELLEGTNCALLVAIGSGIDSQ